MPFFETPINTHAFLRDGHARSRISPQLADMLTRALGRLEYSDMPSDHCDAGPRYRGNIEENPAVASLLERVWQQMASEDLAALHRFFHADPKDRVINVIRLGSGYWLDWHNHLAAQPTATVLLYLFSEKDPGDGGDLLLGEVGPDLKAIEETQRLKIDHGDVIMIGDMTHPLLQHKAERWTGEGWRYLISFAFNAQDW